MKNEKKDTENKGVKPVADTEPGKAAQVADKTAAPKSENPGCGEEASTCGSGGCCCCGD